MKHSKITELNNYSKTNTLYHIRSLKRKRAVRRRSAVIVICGALLIGLASLPILQNIQAAGEYEEKAVELAAELEEVEAKKEKLEYRVSLLEDEEYIAKLARKELNYSKENEILINLPELEEEEPNETEEEKEEEEK